MNRFPYWIKKRISLAPSVEWARKTLADLNVETVCGHSRCPNQNECYARQYAAFLLLGTICTRSCTYCSTRKGKHPDPVDHDEPGRVAAAVRRLKISFAVITSVTRDDLPDGGAKHFAATVNEIRRINSAVRVEVLVPDFFGDTELVAVVLKTAPDVFAHNVETIPRLYRTVRPEADFERSLDVVRAVASRSPKTVIKSGVMLGLGEDKGEVLDLLVKLRAAGCDIVTIGQYLSPGKHSAAVQRFVEPEEFEFYREFALSIGFSDAPSGPFVRSSYCADAMLDAALARQSINKKMGRNHGRSKIAYAC
ncbi:MAG: lipoyl synthase [Candidatus Omnitrophota bacterium]